MKILLDTHMLIWILTGDRHLTDRAKELYQDEKNEIFYSIVSLWEIALKNKKHPENCPITEKDCAKYSEESGIELLDLKKEHIFCMDSLKLKEGHYLGNTDPFDRLLIAQAKEEGLYLLSHDSLLKHFDEQHIILM